MSDPIDLSTPAVTALCDTVWWPRDIHGVRETLRALLADRDGLAEEVTAMKFQHDCWLENSVALTRELTEARLMLTRLLREVFGITFTESALRQDLGYTNYNCLMQRAEEARAFLRKDD